MATIPDMNADSTFAPLPPIFAQLGLAYDDVLLLPNETDVIPSEVDTTTHLTRNITMKVPAISAAMDTVTESDMAIAMARNGGIGVLHRNLSIDDQAAQVDIVKRSESGMISDPLTVSPDVTLADLDKLCGRFHISGLPVVDKDSKLVGIITNRDMRFIASEDYDRLKVSEVMTRENLITGPSDISKEDAHDLLAKHKVEKLPLVDSEGRLTGLITVKDFVKTEQYPDATKDEQGRLRVAAGIGFLGDAYNRASALMEAGVDVLVVDTANGEAKLALDMIRRLKSDSAFNGVDIIGGNVATRQGAQAMAGRMVVVRTLDIGADKQASYFALPQEENPAMGMRAIRICLTRPQIFRTQLRALYRASVHGNLAIMFPMITSLEEVRQVKEICRQVRQELQEAGVPFRAETPLGIMIETPAAALISDRLAPEVDFFSIGTNDLTQYTLAVDRQNGSIGAFCNPHHEAVLRLIRYTVEQAHQAGIWVGICGELAADPSLTQTFVEMGIDELSMSPGKILETKARILDRA